MTEEQLKAYLDSRKMDVVDSAFDASIDIMVFTVAHFNNMGSLIKN